MPAHPEYSCRSSGTNCSILLQHHQQVLQHHLKLLHAKQHLQMHGQVLLIGSSIEPLAAHAKSADVHTHTPVSGSVSNGCPPDDVITNSANHSRHTSLSMSHTSNVDSHSWSEILRTAGGRALGGGIPGSAAMVVQVGCSTRWWADRLSLTNMWRIIPGGAQMSNSHVARSVNCGPG